MVDDKKSANESLVNFLSEHLSFKDIDSFTAELQALAADDPNRKTVTDKYYNIASKRYRELRGITHKFEAAVDAEKVDRFPSFPAASQLGRTWDKIHSKEIARQTINAGDAVHPKHFTSEKYKDKFRQYTAEILEQGTEATKRGKEMIFTQAAIKYGGARLAAQLPVINKLAVATRFFGHDLGPEWIPGGKYTGTREEYDKAKDILFGRNFPSREEIEKADIPDENKEYLLDLLRKREKYGYKKGGGIQRGVSSFINTATAIKEMAGPMKAFSGAFSRAGASLGIGELLTKKFGKKAGEALGIGTVGALTGGTYGTAQAAFSKLLGTQQMRGQGWKDVPKAGAELAAILGVAAPLKMGMEKIPGLAGPAKTGVGELARRTAVEAPVAGGLALPEFLEGDIAGGTGAAFAYLMSGGKWTKSKLPKKRKKFTPDPNKPIIEGRVVRGGKEEVPAYEKPIVREGVPATEEQIHGAQVLEQRLGRSMSKGEIGKYVVPNRYHQPPVDAEEVQSGSLALVKRVAKVVKNLTPQNAQKALEKSHATLLRAMDELGKTDSPAIEEIKAVLHAMDTHYGSEGLRAIEAQEQLQQGKGSYPQKWAAHDRVRKMMEGPGTTRLKKVLNWLLHGKVRYYLYEDMLKGRDLAKNKYLSWGRMVADMERTYASSLPVRKKQIAELKSSARTQIAHDLFKSEHKIEKIEEDARRDIARFADGLRTEGVAVSGTKVTKEGKPEKVTKFFRDLVKKWEKKYPQIRQLALDWKKFSFQLRKEHAALAGKPVKEWGQNTYLFHNHNINPLGLTPKEVLQAYKRGQIQMPKTEMLPYNRYFTDPTMLERISDDPSYILDPLVILNEHIPATISYLEHAKVEKQIKNRIYGTFRRLYVRQKNAAKDIASAKGKLDRLAPGSPQSNRTETPEHIILINGKEYYKFAGSAKNLGRNIKVWEAEFDKRGNLIEKDTFAKLESEVGVTEISKPLTQRKPVARSELKSSKKGPFRTDQLFVRRGGDPKSDIYRVKLTPKNISRLSIRQDGLVHIPTKKNMGEALHEWAKSNMTGEDLRNLSNFEKTLMKIEDNFVGLIYFHTLGEFNTKTPITNLQGGTASNIRTLGLKWAGLGYDATARIRKYKKKYPMLYKMIHEELMLHKTGKKWKLERYDPDKILSILPEWQSDLIKKYPSKMMEMSLVFMSWTEVLNRMPCAWGAGIQCLEGFGWKYDPKMSLSKNMSIAHDVGTFFGNPAIRKLSKAKTDKVAKELIDEIYKDAIEQYMVGAVNKAQNLYGAMSPALWKNPWLRPATMLTQWSGRYTDRFIFEDINDFVTGRDPGKFIRNTIMLGLLMELGYQLGMDWSTVVGEHAADLWPFSQTPALQEGMPLEKLGKTPTFLQLPYGPGPAAQLGPVMLTALNSGLNSNFNLNYMFDRTRKAHGDTLMGILWPGRNIKIWADTFTSQKLPNGKYRTFYAPYGLFGSRKVPKSDWEFWDLMKYNLLPGSPLQQKVMWGLEETARMIGSTAYSSIKRDEMFIEGEKGNWDVVEEMKKYYGLSYTKADHNQRKRSYNEDPLIRRFRQYPPREKIGIIERAWEKKTINKDQLRIMMTMLYSSTRVKEGELQPDDHERLKPFWDILGWND